MSQRAPKSAAWGVGHFALFTNQFNSLMEEVENGEVQSSGRGLLGAQVLGSGIQELSGAPAASP